MNIFNFYNKTISFAQGCLNSKSDSSKKSSPPRSAISTISYSPAISDLNPSLSSAKQLKDINIILNTPLPDLDNRLNNLAKDQNIQPLPVESTVNPTMLTPKILHSLPPVPFDGIQVGLPNINDRGGFGNTCWLNSILKFISSGTEFDSMLTQSVSPTATHAQMHFRNIVATLRTGTTPCGQNVQSIPEKMYKNFLKSLQDLKNPDTQQPIMPRNQGVGYQQDANEYLQAFGKAFAWQPFSANSAVQHLINEERNFPRQATTFTPTNATPVDKIKVPKHDPSMAFITLNLPSNFLTAPQKSIKMAELAEEREVREARHIAEDPKSGNFDWNVRKCFTCLPSTMIVSVNRAVLNDNFLEDLNFNAAMPQQKVNNKVHVDENGLISFIEYKPLYKNENIIGFAPHKTCHYRIDTSLTHLGGANSGHYICEERAASEITLEHSDMQVRTISKGQQFGTSGSLIRLKLVYEEPYVFVEKYNPEQKKEKTLKHYQKQFERERSIEFIPLEMQQALLKQYEKLIILQEESNLYTGKIIPSQRGERFLQSYHNYANLLRACMESVNS